MIEVLKLALEVLEYHVEHFDSEQYTSICELDPAKDAITSLRQAIAEAEKQEPVAWWVPKAEQFCLQNPSGERPFAKAWEPLYTTPQQRKPLTDEDIRKAKHHMVDGAYQYSFMQGVRYAEAAHGIKGEA